MVAIESAILVGPSDDERLTAIGGNLVARGTGARQGGTFTPGGAAKTRTAAAPFCLCNRGISHNSRRT
jgi:hypothetical protein